MNLNTKRIEQFIDIQKERQLAMQELSQILGIDISFSEEEVMQNAQEEYAKYVAKQIEKEVSLLMKSP